MRNKGMWIFLFLVLLIGGSFVFGMLMFFLFGRSDVSNFSSWSGGNVAVVNVEGAIVSADSVIKDIERVKKDDGIKAVILRVESPGGSVAASQEIFGAVKDLAQKKPVVASMGSVAASGGYYVACGATKMLASEGTITGSIGVRMEHLMIGDLLKWAKINHETLKSGRFKDLASMDRPMTPEERAILQGVLDDIHMQFKEAVAKARGLDMADVDRIADGRVYTGRQALGLKLIDDIGGFTEAVALAGKLGGVKGEPKLIRHEDHRWFEKMFDSIQEKLVVGSLDWMRFTQPLFLMK